MTCSSYDPCTIKAVSHKDTYALTDREALSFVLDIVWRFIERAEAELKSVNSKQ